MVLLRPDFAFVAVVAGLGPAAHLGEDDRFAEDGAPCRFGDAFAVPVIPPEVLVDRYDVDRSTERIIDEMVEFPCRQCEHRGADQTGRIEHACGVSKRREERGAVGGRQRLIGNRPEDHGCTAAIPDDQLLKLLLGVQ